MTQKATTMTKGHKETFGGDGSVTLIVMMVTKVYAYVLTYRLVDLN